MYQDLICPNFGTILIGFPLRLQKSFTAAATFSILDTYVPSMASQARSGAGFGIGANLVGFPKM